MADNAVISTHRAELSSVAERIALGALALVVATLPFAHSVAVRNVALGIAVVSTIVAWRSLAVPRVPLLWYFVLFAAIGGLSVINSTDVVYSRSELKPELLYPVAVFVCGFAAIRTRKALAWIAAAAALAIVLSVPGAAVAWFLQWGLYFTDAIKTADVHSYVFRVLLYNGAGFYSTFLVIVYPFALAACFATDGLYRRIALAAAALTVVAGLFTFNRALIVIVALQTIVIVIWQTRQGAKRPALKYLAVALVVSGVLLAAFMQIQQTRVRPAPQAAAETVQLPRDIRSVLWRDVIGSIEQKPWTGWGFGRGILRQPLSQRYTENPLWHAHNIVLNWGLQMGLPGIGLLLALFGSALWYLRRAYRTTARDLRPYVVAAMVMVVGVFLKNQTDDLFVRQTALAFWAALGAVLGVAARTRSDPAAAS